ncbi:MAG: HD domain-containing protein [Candidatus Schekmanbacteria bacterium]|nr:HD domain-containing protein [Candidatus Schekmanbacteria bacterium]
MSAAKTIRDAVHGDIRLSGRAMRVVDTRPVQRLRGIKQLGMTNLVYPSAVHTRFEHSLGTAWLAQRILRALEESCNRRIDPHDRELVVVACLLHDVTHIPFGHTIEDERRVFPRHDRDVRRLRYFLRQPDLAAALDALGIAAEVERLLLVKDPLAEERPFVSQLVSHTICADLLDYLARDNYFCGLRQHYDDRIFRSFRLAGDRLVVDLEKQGFLRQDVLSELIHLLRIRYNLTERVYFHHAKVAAGVMISRAVELAVAEGLTITDLYELGDDSVLFLLRSRFGGSRAIAELLAKLQRRALYRRCYVLTDEITGDDRATLVRRYHENFRKARDRAERAIAGELGIEDHQVIVYCPPARMQLKEAEVLVRLGEGPPRSLADLSNPEVASLQQKYGKLWKFTVLLDPSCAGPRLGRAGEICERYFGLKNQLELDRRGQLSLF